MSNLLRTRMTGLFAVVILLQGCAEQASITSVNREAPSVSKDAAQGIIPDKSVGSDEDASTQAAEMAGREIIYTAQVHLAVDDFDSFPQRLAQTAVNAGGFIAESDVARMQGTKRSGRWVIRVPGPKYASFISAVSGLGVPESSQEKADDVTEKFVDMQARIKSGRQLEEQLIKLLEKQGDRLDSLLTVERELARVRTEIEQIEGRLRFLQSQVALSTIHVFASEQMAFVPEQVNTFSERISREWSASLLRLKTGAENIAIWLAANGLMLLGWAMIIFIAWKLVLHWVWKVIQNNQTANRPLSFPTQVRSD